MKNEKLAEMKRADAFPLGKGRRANLTFLRKKREMEINEET